MVYAIKQTALILDRNQARTQLELLGYKSGDNVYMRFFVPDGDPRHGTPSAARKADKLNWEEVERYQEDGYGVYFVVNGGGHSDKEVKIGRALFCEWDDRPIEDQIFAWQQLNLPEPSMQVGTRKSVHNYWRADLTKDQWIELQQDLLAYTQSDPKLKNPSRVLRLAGAYHIKPGCEPIRCDIIHQSDKVYTYEELRAAIPRRQQSEQPTINYQPSIADDIPLYQFLTKDDRALIDQGANHGSRDVSGAKLARNLIGTAHRLNHLGIRSSGDPRQLLDEYCSRCNPPLTINEAEKIWKSALKDNPTASLTDDALENCAKAWLKNQEKSSGRGFGSQRRGGSGGDGGDGDGGDRGKVVRFPGFDLLTTDDLEQRIDGLIAQKLAGSKLTTELNRLAVGIQWHVGEVKKIYFERKEELEQTDEQVEAQSLLPSLLEVKRLNLREFLWGDEGMLAEAMIETAEAMPTSPEFLFTTLIPTAATLIGTSSRVVVKAKGKYKQPCLFWTVVTARSGQLKTPAQKVVIDPLVQLEIKANEQYQAALEQYRIDFATWKKDKNADPADEPKRPVRKRYITKDATIESLERIHGENPRGLLIHRDEIAEDFKADNAHRSGKGGDKEKKLDQWNGSPIIVDRKEREIALERSSISRTGSIQWEVLQSLMGDGRDDNGTFARWLFCAAESPPRFINLFEDDLDTGIDELLMHLYKRLEKMPENRDYLLSLEAKQLFQQWQHELVRAELEETHPSLQLVYPKIEAYTARFALWLHLVNSALAEVTPPAVVSDRTMSAAIKLAKYYLEQSKFVMVTNTPQSGLTGVLLKIQKYAQGKPNGVKVYKLKSAIKDLRKTSPEVLLSHCKWLSQSGYGVLKDNTYCVDQHDQLLTSGSTRSTLDSAVVSAKSSGNLLTNCCPNVNTVNISNDGHCSDFVDFVDHFEQKHTGNSVTPLNNASVVELCNEKDPNSIELVNTVNTSNKTGEAYTESGVDHEQQKVNKDQHGQYETTPSHITSVGNVAGEVGEEAIANPKMKQDVLPEKKLETSSDAVEVAFTSPLPQKPNIEIVEDTQQFQVGDRVLIQAGGRYDGQVATVIGFECDPLEIVVQLEGSTHRLWFRPEHLTSISLTANCCGAEESQAKPAVDDDEILDEF